VLAQVEHESAEPLESFDGVIPCVVRAPGLLRLMALEPDDGVD
jgi:hypothetical protein